MNILITGGAGFVGSNLALEFKSSNIDNNVIVIDNLKRRGSELNVPRLIESGIRFVHCDVRNKDDLESIDISPDIIIDCSAEPSVMAGINSSVDYLINTNINGTINCLEYARKHDSDFIFLSTSRVYPTKLINNLKYNETQTRFELNNENFIDGVSLNGFSERFPLFFQSNDMVSCRTLYGATKLSSELIIHEYIDMYEMNCVINRCSLITGSWQMGKSDQGMVALWIAKHHYNKELEYIEYKGKQVRDILHVKDLFKLLNIELKNIEGYRGKTYNVGGGMDNSISLIELTNLCQKCTNTKIPIKNSTNIRKGDIKYYVTDNRKVIKDTGWKPSIKVDEILNEITSWLSINSDKLKYVMN